MLIVGATSAIAGEAARRFAADGARLVLTGRDQARLDAVADDLRVRGADQVVTALLDVVDVAQHAATIEQATTRWGGLDVVLIAHGVLPDQRLCQESVVETLRGLEVNFTATTALLTKGGLHIFVQGLRSRLAPAGVSVVEIKPGLVDTPMTAHLPRHRLFASARWVGSRTHDAIVRGRDIVYLPWFWRLVMLGVRLLPERVFKRLRL